MTVSGILYMGAMLFYLRAIQSEEASVVAPLFQATTLFTFLLGYLFLHEELGASQLLGGGLIVGGALGLSLRGGIEAPPLQVAAGASDADGDLRAGAVHACCSNSSPCGIDFWTTTFWTFVGEGLFGAALLARPSYRRQFADLFRRNPGAVIGINAANEVINLGAGLGVRYAALLAPVALVSAISSTTTFFVFGIGILLTLFFPRLGREDLSPGNLVKKGIGALFIAAGVILIEIR